MSQFGILADCSTENLSRSLMKRHVFSMINSCSVQRWLPRSLLKWCYHLIHCMNCAVFLCIPTFTTNAPQRNNCSYLPFSASHNTVLIMRKCDPVCWGLHCFVTCALPHRVTKSCKKVMPSHKINHNEINKQIRCTVTARTLCMFFP
jgi:hypothetical protein